jgi:hypothetical protein
MPAEFDKCVRALVADPNFKPEGKQSKRDAAYAVCVSQYKKRHEGKSPFAQSNINNMGLNDLVQLDEELRLALILLENDKRFWKQYGLD